MCVNVTLHMCVNVTFHMCVNVTLHMCVNVTLHMCVNVTFSCFYDFPNRTWNCSDGVVYFCFSIYSLIKEFNVSLVTQ